MDPGETPNFLSGSRLFVYGTVVVSGGLRIDIVTVGSRDGFLMRHILSKMAID